MGTVDYTDKGLCSFGNSCHFFVINQKIKDCIMTKTAQQLEKIWLNFFPDDFMPN